jgi:hypothetical protein
MDLFEQTLSQYPFIAAFTCAWLAFLLTRSPEIRMLVKTETHRRDDENSEVQNGLRRTLLYDAFVNVPAGVLLLLILFPFVSDRLLKINSTLYAWYGLLGLISYGFPFITVRQTVTKIALTTLLTTLGETLRQLTKVSEQKKVQEEEQEAQKEENQEDDKADKSN